MSSVGRRCGLLFQDLPWPAWRPQPADLALPLAWLALPPSSPPSHLARTLLTHMAWQHGLLPTSLHTMVAIAVTEVEVRHSTAPETSGVVASSVTTVTALVSTSPSAQFTAWAWELLSRLHLHMMDRSVGSTGPSPRLVLS